MQRIYWFIIIFLLLFNFALAYYYTVPEVQIKTPKINPENKIISVSEKFLGVSYKANTLIGSPTIPEELVNNREQVDCFTFLDYVLTDVTGKNLECIRYKDCVVSYETRNHYFTDWIKNNNLKYFITSDFSELKTGDFVGFYTDKPDLDVTHVGIVVLRDNDTYLRHASSKHGKVLDEKLEPRKLVVARYFDKLVEPKIKTDLQYIKYGGPDKCLLQEEVALMLEKAQSYLPDGYNFLVYDCLRPVSIQQKIWDMLAGKPEQKLFANPNKTISLHSYGAAVDLTIEGLNMGGEFDSFDPEFLTQEQVQNRNLLKSVMNQAGFSGIKSEWWHFNAFSPDVVRAKYKVIE